MPDEPECPCGIVFFDNKPMDSDCKKTDQRRTGEDRRGEDTGPPNGWSDRRRTVERRKPDVREISFAEWVSQKARRRNG